MFKNYNRKFKLGMHSYTLHMSGFGESWGFQEYGEHHTFEQIKTFKDLVGIAVEVGTDLHCNTDQVFKGFDLLKGVVLTILLEAPTLSKTRHM